MILIDAEHLIKKAEKEKNDGLLEDDELETIYYELSDEPTVDAIPIEWMLNDWDSKELEDVGYQVMRRIIADWAERKDEYVTLHHEDIHFNSEEDEKAFYEALAEMKNTRSFTAEEWEFYKKVNREKMQKTGLNIRDFMGEERKEE